MKDNTAFVIIMLSVLIFGLGIVAMGTATDNKMASLGLQECVVDDHLVWQKECN